MLSKKKNIHELIINSEKNNNKTKKNINSIVRNNYNNIAEDFYAYADDYNFYPDYEDSQFNRKIYNKLEFNINKTSKHNINTKDKKVINKYSKKQCKFNTKQFLLTQNQIFIKKFLAPNTPYNSILLYHGTGVGKTCSSISIAEQYKNELDKLNRKIIIVLNPSIKANFLKNIFDINNLDSNPYYQCSGNTYIKEILDFRNLIQNKRYDIIKNKINKLIKKRYDFFGYQQLANFITKLEKDIKKHESNKKNQEKLLEKKIKKYFSDSVLIIDEAQNIKEGENGKILPPILKKIVMYSENMKLILLSATPMFDNAREITWLINLLLLNDKKVPLDTNEIFNLDGSLKNENKFIKYIQGYISYIRGGDPFRFPRRVYPLKHKQLISLKNMPKIDKNNIKIQDKDTIKYLNLIGCPMKNLQLEIYNKLDKTEEKFGAFNKHAIMCSNMVYPSKSVVKDITSIDQYIGNTGFKNNITRKKLNKKLKYSIKDENIFDIKNLRKYSSKISTFIDNIKYSDGIVFIYSQFINSGVVPIALALEMYGYEKFGESLVNNEDRPENYTKNGEYIIISGDKDLSKNAYEDYMKIQNQNPNGEKVKIIIGSETASEGLDFSYIREVHILEPWFHLNKIEQIIGRGIRNCSHIDLPYNKRKVKIFLYVSTLSENPKKDVESIDLEIYRKAELKHKQIGKIEYIIKTNAVDCNLNIETNKHFTDKDYQINTNYEKSNYKCKLDIEELGYNNLLNTNTVDYNVMKDDIDIVKSKIKKMFFKKNIYKLEELKESINVDKNILYYSLNDLINNDIFRINKVKGSLYYINEIYIFLPHNLKNKFLTFNNINNNSNNMLNNSAITNTLKFYSNKILDNNDKYNKIADTLTKYIKLIDIKIEENPKFKIIKNNYVDIIPYIYDFLLEPDERKKIKNKDNYRLSLDDYEIFLKGVIEKHINEPVKLDDYEKHFLKKSYFILKNKDIINNLSGKDKDYDKIVGYKIINIDKDIKTKNSINYFLYNNETKTWDNIESTNKTLLSDIKVITKKNKHKKISNFIGYLEYVKKKNNIVFKIKEILTYSKNTKKTKIKRGSICSDKHGKKNEVINYMTDLYSEEKIESKEKLYNLCMRLEFLFIMKNYEFKEEKCFFNPLETIEYGINDSI